MSLLSQFNTQMNGFPSCFRAGGQGPTLGTTECPGGRIPDRARSGALVSARSALGTHLLWPETGVWVMLSRQKES